MNDELREKIISALEDFVQISYCSSAVAEDVLEEARVEAEQIIKQLEVLNNETTK